MGNFSKTLVCALVMAGAQTAYAADIVTHVSVKQPGNQAVLISSGNRATGWLPMPLFRSR